MAEQSFLIPYEEIDLGNAPIPDFLSVSDKKDLEHWKKKLKEIKYLLDRAVSIQKNVNLPERLNNELNNEKIEFAERYNDLFESNKTLNAAEYSGKHSMAISRINSYCSGYFELSSSNHRLLLLNTVLNFENESPHGYLERASLLENQLNSSLARVEILTKELEEKAAKSVVSSYASIFSQQEIENRRAAINWLCISLIFTACLMILLFFSFKTDLFNVLSTETVKQGGQISTRTVYNYSNLVTKVIMISIALYLITFSFRQYSVNRHLQALNNHRKNALNSYELFVGSIGKDDQTSKNALMLQVAKAIYENTTTGYLSAKQAESGSNGFMEITKIVTDAKN